MESVTYKFRIDQKLYWKEMFSIPYMKKCKMCGGSGEIVNKINDEKMECPKCIGNGEFDSGSGSIEERIVSGFVKEINIKITEDGVKTVYILDTGDDDFSTKTEYSLSDSDTDIKIGGFCAGYGS